MSIIKNYKTSKRLLAKNEHFTAIPEYAEYEEIFGINFWAGSSDAAVDLLDKWMACQDYFTISFANPEFILNTRTNRELATYLRKCRAVYADGMGILWASKLTGGGIRERITGTDFQWKIFQIAANQGLRVFLYGGRPGVASAAGSNIRSQLPNLKDIGWCDGYLPQNIALKRIIEFKPDVVMVCLGNPRQEEWIEQFGASTGARLVFGNGGGIDFIAGRVRRAPNWMCNNGLEWFWRLLQDFSWVRIRRQARLISFVAKLVRLKFQSS